MDGKEILASSRTLTLVVDGYGSIIEAAGGFGGFFDVDLLPGTSVFDHVPPADAEDLALYFLENVDDEDSTAALPIPFRLSVIDDQGTTHLADIIPTGLRDDEGNWSWTVVIVPLSLNGSITRSLDLEVAGASRDAVRRMLCEELAVDNTSYTSRWVLIDVASERTPQVLTSRPEDLEVADAVGAAIVANDWVPWAGIPEAGVEALDVDTFPEPLASLMNQRGWQRSIVAPIHVDGELISVFMMVGLVPDVYDRLGVRLNLVSRISGLVNAAAMLMAKWREHDQLMLAASSDSLTGLANREAFFHALESESRVGALLYIDIDRFKSVNDHHGHAAGDRVLIEVATRIGSACRKDDIVARFGGDEFVVLLRRATADVAQGIAERIIEAVAEPLPVGLGPECVSVSIGLAMISNGDNPLDAADTAMLSAKRNGRGRLAFALVSAGR